MCIGGGGVGSVGKKAATETGKALEEAIKKLDDHLTPKPVVVAGTPDVNGGATTTTGSPDIKGGLGKTEVAGAVMAAGYDQPQNPQGIYDPQGQRADLEAVHGVENVKSTTVANDPIQRVNSNFDKGIEVIYDSYGNKAVKVEYKDPLTGEVKFANAAYDDRKLPVFDDYAKYTTKIEKPIGYESMSNRTRRKKEMELATLDLKSKIESGMINRNQFTSVQLSDIYKGSDKIEGYTWHHNSQAAPNNFQLLPEKIHNAINHIGEGALSGGK